MNSSFITSGPGFLFVGMDVLNSAIESIYKRVPAEKWEFVSVAVAPSTITISEHGVSHVGCSKCSKISNTGSLPKRPRQTAQTQIRLFLKKQSDQGLPCLSFWQACC